jgi:hypothetical protein
MNCANYEKGKCPEDCEWMRCELYLPKSSVFLEFSQELLEGSEDIEEDRKKE